MEYTKPIQITLAKWFLRLGLAFVYGYVSFEIYFTPTNFLKYVPPSMQTIMPINLFLLLFGIFEVLLTLWFLSGWHTEYAGLISFCVMAGIIAPNLAFFTVLFRNIAIATSSLALAALDWKHYTVPRQPSLTVNQTLNITPVQMADKRL